MLAPAPKMFGAAAGMALWACPASALAQSAWTRGFDVAITVAARSADCEAHATVGHTCISYEWPTTPHHTDAEWSAIIRTACGRVGVRANATCGFGDQPASGWISDDELREMLIEAARE